MAGMTLVKVNRQTFPYIVLAYAVERGEITAKAAKQIRWSDRGQKWVSRKTGRAVKF